MDGADALTIETIPSLARIDRAAWDGLANPPGEERDPFLSWDFLHALEVSGCVAPRAGWTAAHLVARDEKRTPVGAMPLYAKDHSYGEYVFDHAWADALMRAGHRYYPKLQCAVPFTPVPGRRLLSLDARVRQALAHAACALAQRSDCSSVHVTFAHQSQCAELAPLGYMTRVGL